MASGASAKSKKTRAAIVLHCAGPQMLEIHDQFSYESNEEREDPEKVIQKLEEYCCPKTSEVLQSYRFWNITFKEPFQCFLSELRSQAAFCNFLEKDRMIQDKIVFSTTGKLQELLLREVDLSLKKAIEICQAFEATKKYTTEMSKSEDTAIRKTSVANRSKGGDIEKGGFEKREQQQCRFCSYHHERS